MVTKALKKTEVLLRVYSDTCQKKRGTFRERSLPFETILNNKLAKFDRQGRLWSKYLKNRYLVDTEITITKKDSGYQVTTNGTGIEFSS